MRVGILALIFFLSGITFATSAGDALFRGCGAFLAKYTFECPEKWAKQKSSGRISSCNCWSPEFLATYIDCVKRAEGGNFPRAMESMISTCNTAKIRPNFTEADAMVIYENATNYFVDAKTIKDKKQKMYNPIKFTQAQVNQAQRSFASGFYVKYSAQLYG